MIYIDTETTGLSAKDDVLEYSLIGDNGVILLAGRCRPKNKATWPQAQKIHGIAPRDVTNMPYFEEVLPLIYQVCEHQDIVIYNAAYDMQYLGDLDAHAASIKCCMNRYAEHIGEWDDYHNNFKWHKLIRAAEVAGYEWPNDMQAHSAIGDTMATRAVWQYLDDNEGEGVYIV